MSEVEAALAAIRSCTRPTEFKAQATRLSNRLGPDELGAVYAAAAAEGLQGFTKAALYRRHFRPERQKKLRVFASRDLADGARFFEELGPPAPEKRELLILCSGNAGRMMVAVAVLLDHLPPRPFDVVFLTTPDRLSYRSGVSGLGSTLPEVAAAMQKLFPRGRYRRTHVLGTSAGGFAAVALGLMLGADNLLSLGGRHCYDILRLPELATKNIRAFDPVCACPREIRQRIVAAYAAASRPDRADALSLQSVLPGVVRYPVPGLKEHIFLDVMFRAGLLRRVLADLLSDRPDPRPPPAIRIALGSLWPR